MVVYHMLLISSWREGFILNRNGGFTRIIVLVSDIYIYYIYIYISSWNLRHHCETFECHGIIGGFCMFTSLIYPLVN
jgi:hypothetical protein